MAPDDFEEVHRPEPPLPRISDREVAQAETRRDEVRRRSSALGLHLDLIEGGSGCHCCQVSTSGNRPGTLSGEGHGVGLNMQHRECQTPQSSAACVLAAGPGPLEGPQSSSTVVRLRRILTPLGRRRSAPDCPMRERTQQT